MVLALDARSEEIVEFNEEGGYSEEHTENLEAGVATSSSPKDSKTGAMLMMVSLTFSNDPRFDGFGMLTQEVVSATAFSCRSSSFSVFFIAFLGFPQPKSGPEQMGLIRRKTHTAKKMMPPTIVPRTINCLGAPPPPPVLSVKAVLLLLEVGEIIS